MKLQFGAAYEGLAMNKGHIILGYIFLFYIRRALISLVIVYTNDILILQIYVMTLTTYTNIFLIGYGVFRKKTQN